MSLDFQTAINRTQISDQNADIIKGARQLWDDSPADLFAVRCSAEKILKNTNYLARLSHVSSATVL